MVDLPAPAEEPNAFTRAPQSSARGWLHARRSCGDGVQADHLHLEPAPRRAEAAEDKDARGETQAGAKGGAARGRAFGSLGLFSLGQHVIEAGTQDARDAGLLFDGGQPEPRGARAAQEQLSELLWLRVA